VRGRARVIVGTMEWTGGEIRSIPAGGTEAGLSIAPSGTPRGAPFSSCEAG
jgi:hypothetical protein